jgi:cyclic pyranopterin monophosphate synthase
LPSLEKPRRHVVSKLSITVFLMAILNHFDASGQSRMVDVSGKPDTVRTATAQAFLRMAPATLGVIQAGTAAKGDVLGVARLAGIMAVKKTADLIPLCHPLPVTGTEVAFQLAPPDGLEILASARVTGPTGVEMEALTAAAVAALTVYDMVKAIDRGMVIETIRLVEKTGGQSGDYRVEPVAPTGGSDAAGSLV